MPTIQSSYFTKNGTVEWGNCNALSSDEINVEATVTFSGAEIGLRHWVNWIIRLPNNNDISLFSQYVYATEVTAVFSSEHPILETSNMSGNYTIINTIVSQG